MSIDHRKVADQPSLVAEMREIIEETRKTIEASQVILDRCTGSIAEAPGKNSAEHPAKNPVRNRINDLADRPAEQESEHISLLEGVADGLIVAYEYAKLDNDPLTLALIEKAMLHVGRRLAQAIGPKQAGLACH